MLIYLNFQLKLSPAAQLPVLPPLAPSDMTNPAPSITSVTAELNNLKTALNNMQTQNAAVMCT